MNTQNIWFKQFLPHDEAKKFMWKYMDLKKKMMSFLITAINTLVFRIKTWWIDTNYFIYIDKT